MNVFRLTITFSKLVGIACMLTLSGTAAALPYAVSSDGLAVVRLDSATSIGASSLNTSLLPSGYTTSTATGGSLSVQSFDAEYKGGAGGGKITALFNRGSPLSAGQRLDWIQVGNDNVPLPGFPSPYLDSSAASLPFYAATAANRNSSLPANQLNFYDFSRRSTTNLATVNPITWSADLYPAAVNGTAIEVFDGIRWGWTMKKATVGTSSATFSHPSPATAIVTGVGTNNFTWGDGLSSLNFVGEAFDTTPGTPFKLGKLTFHNGTNTAGTSADAVQFDASIKFTNVPELDFDLGIAFGLVNTPNTTDPAASADFVSIGNFGFTFNVLEGETASVDLFATLTTGLAAQTGGFSANSEVVLGPFDPRPTYTLSIVGLANPTPGGFIGVVPEPSSIALLFLGALVLSVALRPRVG